MTEGVRIRRGRPADAGALARLADALNREDREPTGNFTAAVARRDAFGRGRAVVPLLAEAGGQAVGYALFHAAYDTGAGRRGLYLVDLYVEPTFRRQGVGRALVDAVAAEARRRGCGFVWWSAKPGNRGGRAFYRAVGAVEQPLLATLLRL